MVRLEFRGHILTFPSAQIERAQSLAAAQAGTSSGLRDLALVLDWALNTPRIVALRRSEARELLRLAERHDALDGIATTFDAIRNRARAA